MNPYRHWKMHRKIEKLFRMGQPTYGDKAECWICGVQWFVPITRHAPVIMKRKADATWRAEIT